MSLNLIYSFREGIFGLRRARLATILTVSIISVALSLLGFFLIITVNIGQMVKIFRNRITFEVYMDRGLEQSQIDILKQNLLQIEGIEDVQLITPEMALEEFKEIFGRDPLKIIGDNPLPYYFKVRLQSENRAPDDMDRFIAQIENLEGVEETVYHGRILKTIDRYSTVIIIADGVLFVIVFFAAVFMVSNTLRLTIYAQRDTIRIMELVGATNTFIRRPYLLQGVLQGGIGGAISTIFILFVLFLVRLRFPQLFVASKLYVLTPLVLGLFLGFLGSRVGLKRFLKV